MNLTLTFSRKTLKPITKMEWNPSMWWRRTWGSDYMTAILVGLCVGTGFVIYDLIRVMYDLEMDKGVISNRVCRR